jgi:hypothetical protein
VDPGACSVSGRCRRCRHRPARLLHRATSQRRSRRWRRRSPATR